MAAWKNTTYTNLVPLQTAGRLKFILNKLMVHYLIFLCFLVFVIVLMLTDNLVSMIIRIV